MTGLNRELSAQIDALHQAVGPFRDEVSELERKAQIFASNLELFHHFTFEHNDGLLEIYDREKNKSYHVLKTKYPIGREIFRVVVAEHNLNIPKSEIIDGFEFVLDEKGKFLEFNRTKSNLVDRNEKSFQYYEEFDLNNIISGLIDSSFVRALQYDQLHEFFDAVNNHFLKSISKE